MFITRATRHDMSDVEELLKSEGWEDHDLREGTTFIARDGKVVGCIRVVEVAPQTLVVDDVLVREDRRGEGIGRDLMRAAMNSRGGTMYLCCHDDKIGFYEKFGFTEVAVNALLEPVSEYFDRSGDLHPPEGHEHFYLSARAK
ncbi:MAG TPA: GNAT family N-acetyltransferase [Actinomycetota bacterium]|nr:GNAT family N-acetyltransferase [Actinomycetota bacterium]